MLLIAGVVIIDYVVDQLNLFQIDIKIIVAKLDGCLLGCRAV
jgi:hypothetical protein